MMLQNKEWKASASMVNFGKLISQYALYAAMFCPLHSSISIEQHKKHLCNPSSHYRNTEDSLVRHAPHMSMHESHNASISAILNLIRNIIAVISVSAIFVSRTEAIML